MLRISIELLPGGDASRRRSLGTMTIVNVTDPTDVSGYEIAASEAANHLNGSPAWTAEAQVRDHDRRQSVWRLIEVAASAIDAADKVEW